MSASVIEERGREFKRYKFRNASILVGEAAELIDAVAFDPRICSHEGERIREGERSRKQNDGSGCGAII
jgi:hypothetical protein